jgi:peptide/nickel transport system permease protein
MTRMGVLRRVLRPALEIAVLILLLWSTIFLVLELLPLDPARAVLGPFASGEQIAEMQKVLGLDRPLPMRFFDAMRRYVTFEYGDSIYYRRPAGTIVLQLAPLTLGRALLGTVFGASGALLLIILAQRIAFSTLTRGFAAIFSLPSVVVLVMALLLAARLFGFTPLADHWVYECVAVVACALYPFGAVGSFAAERLGSRDSTGIDFLRSLGLSELVIRAVFIREHLPSALAVAVNSFVIALTAVTIAEVVFNLPGFGIIFVRSCERGDLPVIVAGSSLLGIVLILGHRVAEALSNAADERLQVARPGLQPRGTTP